MEVFLGKNRRTKERKDRVPSPKKKKKKFTDELLQERRENKLQQLRYARQVAMLLTSDVPDVRLTAVEALAAMDRRGAAFVDEIVPLMQDRSQKGDLGRLDTTKKASRYQKKKMHPIVSSHFRAFLFFQDKLLESV